MCRLLLDGVWAAAAVNGVNAGFFCTASLVTIAMIDPEERSFICYFGCLDYKAWCFFYSLYFYLR
ncbi:hypothetical protein BDD12DRAFT_296454 [Trichophaea hybrida]|nr:hypothetical protein BDD12DRAFT_296454 [Trichophaea hybrida]